MNIMRPVSAALAVRCAAGLVGLLAMLFLLRLSASEPDPDWLAGWKLVPYNLIEQRTDGDALILSSRSGGLYFTREGLDPASGQRLDVTGKPLANGTILRIRLDERTPEYAPATEGEINICLEPLSRFEALFYGGAPFSYRLENLSLSTDVDCEVDAAFRKRLLEEIPGLAAALESGEVVRAAHLLLDWAAPVIDWGKPSARVSQTINMGSAANIFSEVFLGDMGGTYCGGSAIFYRKLLEMFGLEAFTVDCGLELGGEQKLTHKTTFLVVEKSEGYAYYLLDPTTGGTFMDRDAAGGEYLDLAAVLVRYDPQSMLLDAPDLWDAAPCVVRAQTVFLITI